MPNLQNEKILVLNPFEFDSHFFTSDWRPSNYGFYDRFHISRIETYRDHLSLPLPPHRRSVHYFMFLRSGTVKRSKNLNSYELKAGQIFFLTANQINTFDYISEDAEGFYCHFHPDIFFQSHLRFDMDNFLPFFKSKSEPIVELKNLTKIEEILLKLEEEYSLSDSERFDLIPVSLVALFLEVKFSASIITPKTKNSSEILTQRYQNALAEFICEKKTVVEFADYLSISANHLNKCVKETTGKSAHDLLQDMRILESKVLLKQSDLSIGEIAFKVGQFETSDFSRLFRKYTNLTPKQYRKIQN